MTEQQTINRDIAISGIAFLLLYYFIPEYWILLIGAVYLMMCFFIQPLKRVNHAIWLAITKLMQSVTSPLLFGAIFIAVLVPFALLFRLFKKKESKKNSTFVSIEQKIDPSFFEVPW